MNHHAQYIHTDIPCVCAKIFFSWCRRLYNYTFFLYFEKKKINFIYEKLLRMVYDDDNVTI